MLQDRVNDMIRQFDGRYEECLRRRLHDTGVPILSTVKDGKHIVGDVVEPAVQNYKAFEFCGQEVFRVTIDEHFAIVTKWIQPCE